MGLLGFNWPPLRCFCHFSSKPVGSEVPKPFFPGLLPQLPTLPGLWVTGQGPNWPFPGPGGPRGILRLRLEFTHSCKHQTPIRLLLSAFLATEEGEGVRETWQSSKEPRPRFTPVDSQLEGIRGREERAGLERQAPPSSYLPAASSLLRQPDGGAWGCLLPLPLMSRNCLLS